MFFDGSRILWPLLLWLIPVLLFTTPAVAAGNQASSASNWILIGIAVTLVVLIGVSLWMFCRSERFGGTARLRVKSLNALPQATMLATIASDTLQTPTRSGKAACRDTMRGP